MLRHMLILLTFALLVSGCGDTYRQQLAKDYQRMIVESNNAQQVEKVCEEIARSEFGKLKPGKIANSYVSNPISFVDKRSGKTGRSVCYLAFIPYETYTEVFVQVSRHIAQDGSFTNSMYSSGFKGNGHALATPMESGENLPASRKVTWVNIGRDRVRENRILSNIKSTLEQLQETK